MTPASMRSACTCAAAGSIAAWRIGDGKVFIGQADAKLVALDQRTGKEVWSIQAEDPLKGYSLVARRCITTACSSPASPAATWACVDASRRTTRAPASCAGPSIPFPGPGEPGHETWPQDNDAWKYGGAPIWQTPAIDPQLGLIYFSTGNAAPDFNGSARAGDNLYSVSILALDVKTGAYRWHFQQVHHDIWDYDSPNPVILFDAPYQGQVRRGIAEVSKTGWVYILDRETGKPLLGIEERPVPQEPRQHTAATQPYVVGDSVVPQEMDFAPEGFTLVNKGRIFTPFWDQMIVYKPQMGVNWPPSSYDPQTHRMFICGIDHVATSVSDKKGFELPNFVQYMGGDWVNPGVARRGIFTAMDLTTNRVVWQQQWPSSCFNGTLATGGGLVFVGRCRWPLHGAGQRQWQSPVAVPDRCRRGRSGQHLLAQWPSVRGGPVRRFDVWRRHSRATACGCSLWMDPSNHCRWKQRPRPWQTWCCLQARPTLKTAKRCTGNSAWPAMASAASAAREEA